MVSTTAILKPVYYKKNEPYNIRLKIVFAIYKRG